jgi:general stress protein 26
VDVEGEKNAEIERYPSVSCGWADNGGHKYVVISGKAELHNDREKISDIWTDFDKAWWEDKNDPTIRLVKLVPEEGELWDGPNGIIAMTKMAIAMVTGGAPDMGQNAKVKL